MPFYEYQCSHCGHSLETMQKVSDAPLKKCPNCGKPQLQKLMSAPVFRLKGGGWYETDFKSEQDSKRNLADRPEADAPKEEKKDTVEAGSKEPAAGETPKTDKAAEKPAAEKPAADAKKKAAEGSAPVRSSGAGKAHPRRSVKRLARTRRAAAKPARR